MNGSSHTHHGLIALQVAPSPRGGLPRGSARSTRRGSRGHRAHARPARGHADVPGPSRPRVGIGGAEHSRGRRQARTRQATLVAGRARVHRRGDVGSAHRGPVTGGRSAGRSPCPGDAGPARRPHLWPVARRRLAGPPGAGPLPAARCPLPDTRHPTPPTVPDADTEDAARLLPAGLPRLPHALTETADSLAIQCTSTFA